ncbi:hypothetical protein Nit79A3_2678 [Nitrosomonas sp. Is79A3]
MNQLNDCIKRYDYDYGNIRFDTMRRLSIACESYAVIVWNNNKKIDHTLSAFTSKALPWFLLTLSRNLSFSSHCLLRT